MSLATPDTIDRRIRLARVRWRKQRRYWDFVNKTRENAKRESENLLDWMMNPNKRDVN